MSYFDTFIKSSKNPKEKWKDGTYDWYSLENHYSGDLEVVGNIYENPELL